MNRESRQFGKVDTIIRNHHTDSSRLVGILQDIQAEYRFLPEEVLTYVATALGVSPATVYGVATFYTQFSMHPKGKFVVKICDGTACHVKGAEKLKYLIQEKLGVDDKKQTTDDLQYTVETVSCIGACGLAPVITVNDTEVHGQLTPEAVEIVINQLLSRTRETGGTDGDGKEH